MKKMTHLILTGLLLTSQVEATQFQSPDILVDSKLDNNWSGLLVRKFRLLMENYGVSDPFKGRFNETMTILDSKVGHLLPDDSKELMRDFGNAIGLNLSGADTKVQLHGLFYDIKDFKTNLKKLEDHVDGLSLSTDLSASEVELSSEKLTFSLSIPAKDGSLPVLKVDVIKPRIVARQDRLINFFTKIKIQDQADFFKLNLIKADFDRMAESLVSNQDDFNFEYEKIIVPEVSIKVGNKKLDFSPAKVEKLLREKHQAIKSLIVAQLAATLKEDALNSTLKVMEKHQIAKEYWLDSNVLKSQMKISQFASSIARNHVEIKIPGDFCTKSKFNLLKKNCIHDKVTKTSETRINGGLHQKSLMVMKNLMESGEANLVASISEDYLNKLLVTTYDAGLWKEALDEAGIDLGPGKVVMRMDKRGDSGTLVMDVIYKSSGLERVALGSKTVRFPLVVDLSLRVEKHDDEPVAIIRLNDVDLSDETLLIGKPQLGIPSNIGEIRMKSTVLKTIRNKLKNLKSKDIIELRYPELRGLGLEKVDFISDGNGRMNALMRLEDLIDAKEAF